MYNVFMKNSCFVDWNSDWKSYFTGVFYGVKNPKFNVSSQNISLEHNFF